MQRRILTMLAAALLLSGITTGVAQDNFGGLAGTITDSTGVGLGGTVVWVAPNYLTQPEMNQLDTAQKVFEAADQRLRAEQTKLFMGGSVVRFVIKEEQDLLQAKNQWATLELAALAKVFPAGRTENIVSADATGGFLLRGLAPGNYVVKAIRPGFTPSPMLFVEVKGGQETRANVTIRPF